ncbi:MAG: hypothetical protein Q9M50_08015 [Methylococcales bacterium]|nr:hypothetical protein [Methylococcales bacterium]
MINFIEAFNQGQEAVVIAEENNLEIRLVFDELNNQLSNATKGQIKIRIGLSIKLSKPKIDNASLDVAKFNNIFSNKVTTNESFFKEENDESIIAYNPSVENSKKIEIAKWSKDNKGYPCKITRDYRQHYCEDKIALENTLADMLKDPSVGKIFQELMQPLENKAA